MIALLLVTGLAVYPSGNYLHHAHPKLHGPALALSENSSVGWQEWIDAVRGCTDCDAKLDVAVIGTTGADELNAGFMSLHGVNSVETYILTAREPAQVAGGMERGIGDADVVFFKGGGSQCDFARWIRGTLVQHAVERVYQRGGGVGGDRGGQAIQGEVIFDACPGVSVQSSDALADPFSPDISLSSFFSWPPLRYVITDGYFH